MCQRTGGQRSIVNALTVADNIQLGDQLRRKAGLLSGGQQQMLTKATRLTGHDPTAPRPLWRRFCPQMAG
jgi:ABC-type branched-subunit amino acid transport system ATPase component